MILSKQRMIEAMNLILEQDAIMEEVNNAFRRLGDGPSYFNVDSLHLKALRNILGDAMCDSEDYIGWWLYERVDKTIEWIENDQYIKKDVSKPEDLWDFLCDNAVQQDLPYLRKFVTDEQPNMLSIPLFDLHLMFDACFQHIHQTGHMIHATDDNGHEFVIMRKDQWSPNKQQTHSRKENANG